MTFADVAERWRQRVLEPRLAGRAPSTVDRARWLTVSGSIRVDSDPDAVADAVQRYAGRYREPRVNPLRVVLVMDVTKIMGHV